MCRRGALDDGKDIVLAHDEHVPERCQAASGYTQTGRETFELDVAGLGLPTNKLTIPVCRGSD